MSSDCPFCRIVNGRLPVFQIYQDDLFLAFLDIKPLNPGNSLIIPKKHYRWVYDVPEFSQYWQVAQKIALATIRAVGADYLSFLTLGTEVPHAHIRLIPRFYSDAHAGGIDVNGILRISPKEMTEIAQNITNLLKEK